MHLQVEMGSLNMSVVELDEPRHVRHIANLIQEIQFKRDLLQVISNDIITVANFHLSQILLESKKMFQLSAWSYFSFSPFYWLALFHVSLVCYLRFRLYTAK